MHLCVKKKKQASLDNEFFLPDLSLYASLSMLSLSYNKVHALHFHTVLLVTKSPSPAKYANQGD